MKHNVIFQIEKRKDKNGLLIETKVPLFADIRYSGTRLFYFTGYRIDKSCFYSDKRKQEALKNTVAYEGGRTVSYADVNRRLKLIEATLTLIFSSTQIAPEKAVIKAALNKVLAKGVQSTNDPKDFLQMFQSYIDSARLSEARKNHVISTRNHWQRFADKKKITLTFDSITPDTLRAFEKFLLSEKVVIKKTQEKKAARGINTLHSIFAQTRTFWNHARKELAPAGIVLQYPFDSYKVPAEVYGTPIFLTQDERNKLFEAIPSNDKLKRVRDIFIFQCLTGARVADLCKFTKHNVTGNILSYIPRKTKEGNPVTVTIPLSSKAKELISRYDMPDGRLMPFITQQNYNDYLKELFEEVGLTRIVTRQHPTTREMENVRLCDIASSHIARRTFVGNMFGKIDSAVIASMSGHVANSKAFARYYDVSPELQKNAIALLE